MTSKDDLAELRESLADTMRHLSALTPQALAWQEGDWFFGSIFRGLEWLGEGGVVTAEQWREIDEQMRLVGDTFEGEDHLGRLIAFCCALAMLVMRQEVREQLHGEWDA